MAKCARRCVIFIKGKDMLQRFPIDSMGVPNRAKKRVNSQQATRKG
jgi:hypothetical protein